MTLDDAAVLAARMADYRATRAEIERHILPLATSIDGHAFDVQASLYDLELRRGGYVVLEQAGRAWLGQVTDLGVAARPAGGAGAPGTDAVTVRLAMGSGVVLDGDGTPFHDATVRPAAPAEVGERLGRGPARRAGLTVGELLLAPGVPAVLDSGGLGRHTFMCGQSGSGKTYSLGVLLERLLAETTLRVVVLDPNSDYVGLGRLREGADPALAARYAPVLDEVAVWRNDAAADHPLRLRFADLDLAVRAAVLGLDPVRDREEYAVLSDIVRSQEAGRPLITDAEQLLRAETRGARELGQRAVNLGVLEWRLWGPDLPSLVGELREPTARCTVVDLGSLDTLQEQRLVAEAVLSTLWEARLSRRPCLVVIDEAHNICPAAPPDDVSRLATERAVQIAAEGRKYGLYLLTSTQRPHKVDQNVVSQCDNLVLMRMNSAADLADLGRLFSFVPPGLFAGATAFGLGQALVAGKVLPQAAYVQMGRRVSEEGGGDVPATWAARRG
ncbi:ATP-binding protein [Georgenia thermotolerans]|uniref:ATP-binding protein n=1 Tax=Georgenia thermotolerans TaxID=527326 RepID=UPI001B8CE4F2|nr:ATP-binding protein [Georgenia thermotolerans]